MINFLSGVGNSNPWLSLCVRMHVCAHTHTYTHTHTQSPWWIIPFSFMRWHAIIINDFYLKFPFICYSYFYTKILLLNICSVYIFIHLFSVYLYSVAFSVLFIIQTRTFLEYVKVKVAQSCLTLCNPMDYIVHGIL